MTLLSTFISSGFSSAIRSRGTGYIRRVTFRVLNAMEANAIVDGTDSYEVDVAIEKEGVFVSCTCPYYESNEEPCKHIWATVVAAEQRGQLEGDGLPIEPFLLLQYDVKIPLRAIVSEVRSQEEYEAGFTPRRRGPGRPASSSSRTMAPTPPKPAPWEAMLTDIENRRPATSSPRPLPGVSQLHYLIDATTFGWSGQISIELMQPTQKHGQSSMKGIRVEEAQIPLLPDPVDRHLTALLSATGNDPYSSRSYPYRRTGHGTSYTLRRIPAGEILPEIFRSDRASLRLGSSMPISIEWDERPVDLRLEVRRATKSTWNVAIRLSRHGEDLPIGTKGRELAGMFVTDGAASPISPDARLEWLGVFGAEPLPISDAEIGKFLERLFRQNHLPPLDLPEELTPEEVSPSPAPHLILRKGTVRRQGGNMPLTGELFFDYDGHQIAWNDGAAKVYDGSNKRLTVRDREKERAESMRLEETGFRRMSDRSSGVERFEIFTKKLPSAVRKLLAEGWLVEGEGGIYRTATSLSMSVKSGVDWFDLNGAADFGGASASLPSLLAALGRGEDLVMLDDGSVGIVPEAWIKRYERLSKVGSSKDGVIRFSRAQIGLLDALLDAQPDVEVDRIFEQARTELLSFDGIAPADPPETFVGTLRDYQRDALGWMGFLQRFGFGGCLADDMGLGKTPMALALLAGRLRPPATKGRTKKRALSPALPSLVVVPRSLVFNWMREAERFVPSMRIVEHHGIGRSKDGARLDGADLIVTTYGTLVRDVQLFASQEFDYLILDEAQAVKNASTEASKAVRLLRARHRLALSGTPIENHLGELWSLFEFLNPGMLGAARALGLAASGSRAPDDETKRMLARALKPFILRRTKKQVAKELPPKTEQTIWCELEGRERKQYDDLRKHYTTERLFSTGSTSRGSSDRRSTSSKHSFAFARRPAIPACSTSVER